MAVNTAPQFVKGFVRIVNDVTSDAAHAVTIQADGKIVVAGDDRGLFLVERHNADGSLDLTFDGDGRVQAFTRSGLAYDVAALSGGKIRVAGTWNPGDSGSYDVAVAQFLSNGAPDTGFGVAGTTHVAFANPDDASDTGFGMAVLPDGRFVVAGEYARGAAADFGVMRLNANGTVDTSFAGDGTVTTDFGGSNDFARNVAAQADGKLVVVGYSTAQGIPPAFAVARYNTDGSLDASFSADGKVVTRVSLGDDRAVGVVIQADGKIVVAGTGHNGSNADFALVRYNVDGALDSTFSGDGRVVTPIGTGDDMAAAVALQSDGKILVAGKMFRGPRASSDPNVSDFALARYNTDGTLDTSFGGGDGIVTTDVLQVDTAYGLVVQPDGKIVVVGSTTTGVANVDVLLARYNSDGSYDTTFGPQSPGVFVSEQQTVGLDSEIKVIDAELAARGDYGGASITLSRHGGPNAEDVFTNQWIGPFAQEGSVVAYRGDPIGTLTRNSGGVLTVTFDGATQAEVDGLMRAFAYTNTSNLPPATVQIDWQFSDGNAGDQGTGGTLSTVTSTIVHITAINDAPSFTAANVNEIVAVNTGLRMISGWATNMSAGPGEFSQSLDFIVTSDNAALFSQGPAVSVDGTLTYTLAPNAVGTANVTVRLHDNGGAPGIDVSAPATLVIQSTAGPTFHGTAREDTIIATSGEDALNGGERNDHLYGRGGPDTLDGGPGFDIAHYDLAPSRVIVDLVNSNAELGEGLGDSFVSVEGIVGSAYGDRLFGDAGNNLIDGGGSPDFMDGRQGDDVMHGGDGADTLVGGPGEDLLIGDAGDDALQGGDQNDRLEAGAGADRLDGGASGDTLDGGAGPDRLDGGAGYDFAIYTSAADGVVVDLAGIVVNTGDARGDQLIAVEALTGSQFDDRVYGDSQSNTLDGRNGNDMLAGRGGIDHLYGGAGADVLDGGDGLDYAHYTSAVTVDLGRAHAGTGEALGDTFVSIEAIAGSDFIDQIYGGDADDLLIGGKGADLLDGGGGADVLHGEGDNDSDLLMGGAGDDTLYAGGNDRLDGGTGFDYARFAESANGVVVSLASGFPSIIESSTSVEGLIGTRAADSLRGNDEDNVIYGSGGNDQIFGMGGRDTLYGGAGHQQLEGGIGGDVFRIQAGDAHSDAEGDAITDFKGAAVLGTDQLLFAGFGAGATFVNVDSTHWRVSSADHTLTELITMSNAPVITAADYSFI